MKYQIEGRLRNIQVPGGPGAILLAIYEAVSNAVHAIEERVGTERIGARGKIDISVSTSTENLVREIRVTDNGIGLTPSNLDAFETCDSLNKADRGGKGVGRLIWFKLAKTIDVKSTYEDGPTLATVSFEFLPSDTDTLHNLKTEHNTHDTVGTCITLRDIYESYNFPIKKITIAKELALHFFTLFISGNMPSVTIWYNENKQLNLTDYIKSHIHEFSDFSAKIKIRGKDEIFRFQKITVDRLISNQLRNTIILSAHGRMVERRDIEKRFALKHLPNRQALIFTAEADILDATVDQERTSFKLTSDEIEHIFSEIIDIISSHVHEHIAYIRERQAIQLANLIKEHPQLSLLVGNIEDFTKTLSPGMDEEQIGQSLFALLYRKEKAVSRAVKALSETENLTAEAEEKAKELAGQTTEQARLRLAEYVTKRHQIIDIANTLRKSPLGENYAQEKLIHDLICPMGNIYTKDQFDSHNLWLVDDLLAYYQFFASDKQIRVLSKDSTSQDEPDIIFFNPLGFERRNTKDPVVIVEFKRPGVESLSSDPIEQVLRYVDQLRSRTVRAFDGEVRSDISETTPFECIVLCELTQNTRQKLRSSLAQTPTPDDEGYYGYSVPHKASIRVISYNKMLRDAELRNTLFFKQLGLLTN